MTVKPPSPTSYGCGGCDNRWTGLTRCHCSGCHATFGGVEMFDAHRREKRGPGGEMVGYCQNPAEIMRTPKVTGTPERAMWEIDGIWRGSETVAVPVPPRRGAA